MKYNFIDDSKLILLRADKFINLIKYIPNNIFNSINIRTSGGTVYDVISSFNYLVKTNNIKNLYGIFSKPKNPNNNKNIGGTIFGHYIGEYAIYTFIDNIIKKKIDKDNINIQRLVIFSNNLDMGFANHAIALMFEVDLKHHSYNAILIDTSLYYSGQKKYKVQNKFIDYLIDKFNDYIKEKINPIYKLKIIKDCQPYITFPYVIQKYGDCWLKCIVISLCLNKNNYILDSLKILDFGKKYIKFLDRYYVQEYISYYDKYYNQLNDIYNFNIEKRSNN